MIDDSTLVDCFYIYGRHELVKNIKCIPWHREDTKESWQIGKIEVNIMT